MTPPTLWKDAHFIASRLSGYPIYSPPHIVKDEWLLPRTIALENFNYFEETRTSRVAAALELTRDWPQPLPSTEDFAVTRRDIMRFLMRYGVVLAYADMFGLSGSGVPISREGLFECQLRGGNANTMMARRLSLLNDIGTLLGNSVITDSVQRGLPKIFWTFRSSYVAPPDDLDTIGSNENETIVARLGQFGPGVSFHYKVFKAVSELRHSPSLRKFGPYWDGFQEQIIFGYSGLYCELDEKTGGAVSTENELKLLQLNCEFQK
jgi:hypothetical protein